VTSTRARAEIVGIAQPFDQAVFIELAD